MHKKTWRDRYQLLDPVGESGASFRGRESDSAAPVLIHLLGPSGNGSSRAVLHELMALPPGAYTHVREYGEEDGASYVVTDLYFGAEELSEWVKRARSGAKAPPAPEGVAPEDQPTEEMPIPVPPAPGEFTRVFSPPAKRLESEAASAASIPAPPPGEFTQVFSSSPVDAPAEARPSSPPGEFTRVFSSPPVDAPAPSRPSPPPGEFTRVFSSSTAPPPLPAAPRRGGEITSLFERRPAPPPKPFAVTAPPAATPPPEPPRAAEPGDFTRLLGPVASPAPAPIATQAAAPLAPPPAHPSDYTLVVSSRPAEPPPASPSPASAAKPQAPRRDLRPMLVFSVLTILAVTLILLAAFGR